MGQYQDGGIVGIGIAFVVTDNLVVAALGLLLGCVIPLLVLAAIVFGLRLATRRIVDLRNKAKLKTAAAPVRKRSMLDNSVLRSVRRLWVMPCNFMSARVGPMGRNDECATPNMPGKK